MVEPDDRLLITLGLRDQALNVAKEAASLVGASVSSYEDIKDFTECLESQMPLAVLVRPGQLAQAATFNLRTQPRFANVPIFGAALDRSDLSFVELFTWGGDDLVSLVNSEPLSRRLRILCSQSVARASQGPGEGYALVAGADPQWRTVMARALFNGGFRVRFSSSATDTLDELRNDQVRMVVAADGLRPDGAASVFREARKTNQVPWVVVASPKRLAACASELRGSTNVAIADAFGPPENVLFVANDLIHGRGGDKRAAVRLLYGTSVAFRPAGREVDDVGFSYNLSSGGVYVRTLAPCDVGQEIWLELWPPRSERRVRLAGSVAWVRPFGSPEGATAPPGCGVQLSAGLAGDLERYREGVDVFERSHS